MYVYGEQTCVQIPEQQSDVAVYETVRDGREAHGYYVYLNTKCSVFRCQMEIKIHWHKNQ